MGRTGKIVLISIGSFFGLIILIGFIFGMQLIGINNQFIELEENVSNAWAQVENQFQRRYDLIPNLVNTVKGYADHEEEVLTSVTEARAKVGSAQGREEQIEANGELSSALSRLMVVKESYPDLKANENFLALQSQLEGTENRISVERRRYNEAVTAYNKFIRKFPNSILASIQNKEPMEKFEADTGADEAPDVNF
ncbi:MAG: LemA family protein [Chitinivibrionales bacterium]